MHRCRASGSREVKFGNLSRTPEPRRVNEFNYKEESFRVSLHYGTFPHSSSSLHSFRDDNGVCAYTRHLIHIWVILWSERARRRMERMSKRQALQFPTSHPFSYTTNAFFSLSLDSTFYFHIQIKFIFFCLFVSRSARYVVDDKSSNVK
jgi:hypothetical protein